MRAAKRWTIEVVVTLTDRAAERATLELRVDCWLERVARLIARRDTPRDGAAAADLPDAAPRA